MACPNFSLPAQRRMSPRNAKCANSLAAAMPPDWICRAKMITSLGKACVPPPSPLSSTAINTRGFVAWTSYLVRDASGGSRKSNAACWSVWLRECLLVGLCASLMGAWDPGRGLRGETSTLDLECADCRCAGTRPQDCTQLGASHLLGRRRALAIDPPLGQEHGLRLPLKRTAAAWLHISPPENATTLALMNLDQ